MKSFSFLAMRGVTPDLWGLAFDGSGNLWTKRRSGYSGETCGISEFPAPLSATTSASTQFPFDCGQLEPGLAFDAQGKMYSDSQSGVEVFDPPFGGNATPAFTIPVQTPQALAFDRRGNLYVSTGGNIVEFSPPFTSGSAPVVTLATPSGATGIAIGQ